MYELTLPYSRPYDWPALLAFFAARAVTGVEEIRDESYFRSVRLGRSVGTIDVRPLPGGRALVARIDGLDARSADDARRRLERMFDTTADPRAVRRVLSRDPMLASRLRRKPGIRVPGAWEPFEIVVRAIVGQQISVAGARTILGRIASRASTGERLTFPAAEELAATELRGLGMTDRRAECIRAVARAVAEGMVDLDGTGEHGKPLESLPGIGPWTAGYVAMRAHKSPDAFPHGDLVLRREAGNGALLTARQLEARAEAWRPWRAYATMLLWAMTER